MRKANVAILGATGAVGEELAHLIVKRQFPLNNVRLLASPRSAGKKVTVGSDELVVEAVNEESFRDIDIAFFSAGGGVSKEYAPLAVKSGAVVIDNTSAFRLDKDVPLVVPEVNPGEIIKHKGIIANPNCSTIIMAVALKPIFDAVGIERLVISTYQAVSGAGAKGIQELHQQVVDYVNNTPPSAKVLPVASEERHYPIAFNAIPQIDVFAEQDYTKEEWKMICETRKIFGTPDMRITATTVRLPIMRSHCESINIQTKSKMSADECRQVLANADGITVLDDPKQQKYPMPVFTSGEDPVYVGRIREDDSIENGLNIWVVGDQIRKGAALNAIQIGEHLVQQLG